MLGAQIPESLFVFVSKCLFDKLKAPRVLAYLSRLNLRNWLRLRAGEGDDQSQSLISGLSARDMHAQALEYAGFT